MFSPKHLRKWQSSAHGSVWPAMAVVATFGSGPYGGWRGAGLNGHGARLDWYPSAPLWPIRDPGGPFFNRFVAAGGCHAWVLRRSGRGAACRVIMQSDACTPRWAHVRAGWQVPRSAAVACWRAPGAIHRALISDHHDGALRYHRRNVAWPAIGGVTPDGPYSFRPFKGPLHDRGDRCSRKS